ncbi:DDRGK domain-containing protein 1 isoform X2 [Diprion similis]|uniref:DDRGK domain-containing protein 1 isoform X2 n=1 Tax=Diprion similis TaxID=362088 RepID=UPI001EF8F6FE|nr:DDRGK domain-containing protein 1 isoform X2 [Diprion similis]
MDVLLLVTVVTGLVVLLIVLALFSRKKADTPEANVRGRGAQAHGQQPRRAAGVRNARQRMRGNAAAEARRGNESDHSNDANDENEDGDIDLADSKLGAKKRAKLEAKAEKKLQREAAEREREERRKRDQLLQEERDKQSEKERMEEAKLEEAEKKAREEKERKEYEEYIKMKEAFSVEEEGYEDGENTEEENLLTKFIDYIKVNKVVVLEDLAAHFRMKTVSVIERIQSLQADGNLTGVVDDRGKFIYISTGELEAVAKFIRQRGRVSITELAENSNILINLNPSKTNSVSA